MSEEEKQAIIDFMKSKKGKTKHYFNELCKAVPHMKMRAAKKVINEMVNDGQLKYWSSGSTTLYLLPEHADVSKEEEGIWQALTGGGKHIDEIIRIAKLSSAQVLSCLTQMEPPRLLQELIAVRPARQKSG